MACQNEKMTDAEKFKIGMKVREKIMLIINPTRKWKEQKKKLSL